MKKIKLKIPKVSLRFFVTTTIILLCALMLIIFSFAVEKVNYKNGIDELKKQINAQCNMLEQNLIDNNFSMDTPKDLNTNIDSVASHFEGRVMVINSEYRIIKDSFANNQAAFIVNEEIIEVMTGDKPKSTVDKDNYIQHIRPIIIEGETVGVLLLNATTVKIIENSNFLSGSNVRVALIVLIFGVLVASIIGAASVKGINSINKQMENIRDGHLDNRIEAKGFKEFRALTNNYNNTISKLMVIDSTRQEFVSNVSHELKTPITSIKVLADSLVQNEEADLQMYKEFMTDIIDEIDRESKIINDLLTLVKTDKKAAKMNIEEVDINALLEVIIKRVMPIANNRGIEITYDSYREVKATVDEVKLSLALTNIIENAVKYNIDNGFVKVTLNADHKNFHIKVADSGVGIPDDCKEHIFERFYRVDKARSRDTGGTGLGLAITKNVILMHKGTIKLYSESGEGTTFTIKIPIKYVES